jgi:hypothetical protein
MNKPSIPAFVAVSVLLAAAVAQPVHADGEPTSLESAYTCKPRLWGRLTEQGMLAGWAWLAETNGTEDLPDYIATLEAAKHVQPYSLKTVDGRVLQGRKASFADEQPAVAVLVASGNVATADSMLRRLEPLLKATRYDFYFVDYRGFGRSDDGYPSLQALIQDFVSMGEDVRRRGYRKVMAYGPSLGGVILMNAAAKGLHLDKLIVDSVPSNLNNYKCDISVAPTTILGSSCPGIVAISGKNDHEVSPRRQKELLAKVEAQDCRGRVMVLPNAAHALNDRVGSTGDLERMRALQSLLLED